MAFLLIAGNDLTSALDGKVYSLRNAEIILRKAVSTIECPNFKGNYFSTFSF